MKKTIILITLIISNIIFAQSNEQKAFKLYKEAKENYFESNYKKTTELIYEAIELNGKNNIQLQTLLVLSLNKYNQWNKLEIELPKYYDLKPDKKTNEYTEIQQIKNLVNEKIKEENIFFFKVKASSTIENCEEYIEKFPEGKNIIEIKNLLLDKKDDEAWKIAKIMDDVESMFTYIQNYPNGKFVDIAKKNINDWDLKARNEALNIDTQESLNKYLVEFKNGKYRNEIQDRLKIREEEDLYNLAIIAGSINSYKNYLKKYSNGKFVNNVNELLEGKLFENVKKSYEDQEYSAVAENANSYLNVFSIGQNSAQVSKLKNRAERNLKKTNASMLLLTYETNESFGIQFGTLRKKNIGWYLSLRANKNVLDATFKEENILTENEFDTLPFNIETISASSSLGLTFPVLYPLYLSAGVGVNYKEYFYINEITDKPFIFSVEGSNMYEVFPEANLLLRLGPVVISSGASYIREEIVYRVGLGFKF